ncbi:MAG: acylphosphatase [Candidatus Marsarchaeota archaeon]|jgi:acylphosphatase|nr:acylphosphatase [Candidatus Marsarchaeota archaeon]
MGAIKITVHGVVQGVGYRALVRGIALRMDIAGYAKNMPDGSVEVLAIGEEQKLNEFSKLINVDTEHGPQVHKLEIVSTVETNDYDSFYVR